MTTAGDIMTKAILTLSTTHSLAEAATALSRRGVSGAPVCDADRRVVGVVSKSDLADAWLAEGPGMEARVGEVMTTEVITARPDEDVRIVTERLIFEGIHRVVVVDAAGVAVGIVCPLDVLRAIVAAGPFEARALAATDPQFLTWPPSQR